MTTYSCSRIRTLRHEIARTGSDEARVAASAQEREAASVQVHAPLQSACTRCHTNPKSWVWARQVPGTSRPAAAQSKRRGVVLRSRSGTADSATQSALAVRPPNATRSATDASDALLNDPVPAGPRLRNTGRCREPMPRARRSLEIKRRASRSALFSGAARFGVSPGGRPASGD